MPALPQNRPARLPWIVCCCGLAWAAGIAYLQWLPQNSTALVRVAAPDDAPLAEWLHDPVVLAEIPGDALDREEPSEDSPVTDQNHERWQVQSEGGERWLVRLQTAYHDGALTRLTTTTRYLLDKLRRREQIRQQAQARDSSLSQQEEITEELQHATIQLAELQQEQGEFDDSISDSELLARTERLQALERHRTATQLQRTTIEQDWRFAQQELARGTDPDSLCTRLAPGPVTEALRNLSRQQQLQQELQLVQAQWNRETGIYGARHPRSLNLALRMTSLKTQLGLDPHAEYIAEPRNLSEQLNQSLEAYFAQQDARGADLDLQYRMERDDLVALRERKQALTEAQQRVAGLEKQQVQLTSHTTEKNLADAIRIIDAPWMDAPRWPAETAPVMGAATLIGLCLALLMLAILQPRTVSEPVAPPDFLSKRHPVPTRPVSRSQPPVSTTIPPPSRLSPEERRVLREKMLQAVQS